jgi:glutamate/tyrosine decarboxylase-like PLP-dependent enzyme
MDRTAEPTQPTIDTPAALRSLLVAAADHAAAYLNTIDDTPVAPTRTGDELRVALGGALNSTPRDPRTVLDDLVTATAGGLMGSTGGRFFGWVMGGSVPAALAADWLAAAWDQNAGIYACSPAAAVVEQIAGDWLLDLLGLPAGASYGFVTGCQGAHTTALAAARHQLLAARGIDVEADGVAAGPPIRILTSRHRHVTIDRAARLLGLGANAVSIVVTTSDGRISIDALAAALTASDAPTIVVLQAGDVNSGLFDPIADAVALAKQHDAWVHIDGAFGLWAATSPTRRHLLAGHSEADSWASDAHKWLNVPYDCGLVFCRHPDAHRASMRTTASYLVHSETERDEAAFNLEFSRRARGFAVYAALRSLGRDGISDLIDRTCDACETLVNGIGSLPGAEIVSPASINQGLVRFLDPGGDHDTRTDAVINAIQKDGTCWFGGTTWEGQRAMRISVCNWQTNAEHVRLAIDAVRRVLAAM